MIKKQSIIDILGTKRLFFDGGTGTVLQKAGLEPDTPPEAWNLRFPEKITALHREYLLAGADIIKTNTFGVNSLKYENYKDYILAAMGCARAAVEGLCDKFIAFDIGPLGKLLKPFGELDFEDAVEVFARNIRAAEGLGADLILIETMNDAFETKAAVLAAKENSSLPIFVTNVYDEGGKLLTGATPEAMAAMLEGLGVCAIGANCSLGPDKLLPVAERLCAVCSVPVIINPNAGLPVARDGGIEFDIDPDRFASYMARMASLGVSVMGGCCGTDARYIAAAVKATADVPYVAPAPKALSVISSYAEALYLGGRPILIGERINPTGKPRLKEALRSENISYILDEAISEEEAGADALDVNVGLPEINEAYMMRRVISEIQSVSALPLQIDSGSAEALEAAMRVYGGKPLVNSVNGKRESMDAVFPLVKKYGGTVVCLTMDESGIPDNAADRVKIAEKIAARAAEYGIGKESLIIDPLAMAVSSDSGAARVTLEAVEILNGKGYLTSLGVSNVSFGLPSRDKINAAYFTLALEAGLDAAIINPHSTAMLDAYRAYLALSGADENFSGYISYADSLAKAQSVAVRAPSQKNENASEGKTLGRAIFSGLKEQARAVARELIRVRVPLDVINGEIIPALTEVGDAFEQGRLYLPQLLMSAEAAGAAFEVVKAEIPKGTDASSCGVILATVKGDIHDIGKNIVKTLLESYGYDVLDLGRDVAPERVARAVRDSGIRLVGLSALMTTTVAAMEETVRLLHAEFKDCRVMVGGAVLNPEYAEMIGADYYAKDAMGAVRVANGFYKK